MNCWIWILLLLCCSGNKGNCGCTSSTRCMENREMGRMCAPEPPERMAPPRPPRPPYEDCGCE